MRDGFLEPDVDSSPAVAISKLGRRRWRDALAMFYALRDPDAKTRAAALNVCAKALQLRDARRIFDEMPDKSVAVYNSLIELHGRLRMPREAELLLGEMLEASVQPDEGIYTALITAHGMRRNVHDALRVFADMQTKGLTANPSSYGAAIYACARAGDHLRAVALLEQMRAHGVKPDIGHFTGIITSCAKDGQEPAARRAFGDIRVAGLKPDIVAYTALMGCIAGGDALEKVEVLFKEMLHEGIQPDSFVFNALLKAAVQSGDVLRFNEFLAEMDARGLRRTRETELRIAQAQDLETFDEPGQLPPGWSEAHDPSSGLPYYWREEDPAKVTQWDRPES